MDFHIFLRSTNDIVPQGLNTEFRIFTVGHIQITLLKQSQALHNLQE